MLCRAISDATQLSSRATTTAAASSHVIVLEERGKIIRDIDRGHLEMCLKSMHNFGHSGLWVVDTFIGAHVSTQLVGCSQIMVGRVS